MAVDVWDSSGAFRVVGHFFVFDDEVDELLTKKSCREEGSDGHYFVGGLVLECPHNDPTSFELVVQTNESSEGDVKLGSFYVEKADLLRLRAFLDFCIATYDIEEATKVEKVEKQS